MKRFLAIGLVALAISSAWAIGVVRGGGQAAPTPAAPEGGGFAGRVVAVSCKNANQGGVFEEPQVRELGGRTFLVGAWASQGQDDNPWVGIRCWMPFDEITQIFEFKDVEQARKAYSALDARPR